MNAVFLKSVQVRTRRDLSEIVYISTDFLATFAWHFCLQILVDLSSSTFSLILKEFNIGHKFSNVFKWNRNMEVLSYLLNFKYKFEAVKEFRYKPLIRVKMKMSLQSMQQFTFEDIEK